LILLVCQGRAQESDYIVADAVGTNDAFYRVAERLAAHRRGKIISLDLENLNALREALRQTPPRYVAVVLRPEQLEYDFARKFLVMATQLDDDPFVDFSYGFITGATAEEALAFVERSIKSEETHREPNLGSIGVWEITRSTEVLSKFPSRSKSIAHLEGRLASPQQLQDEERDTQFIKRFLPKLQGKSVVVFGGHGYPREVVGGPTWKDLAGLKLDSAVALNIACYTGVTETWFENNWKDGVVRKREIPMSESFALALLRTGVIGYVAYVCERPAGPELFTDVSALVSEGMSLGDVRRRDYDKIVLGYLGYGASKMELKPVAEGQKIEPPKDIAQDFMLESGTGGILFGDPALVPFNGNSNGAPVAVKVAHDEIKKTLLVTAEVAAEHLGYFCSEPTASWDGRAGEAMKVYTKVPLPAGYVSGVGIQRCELGNVALKSRLVWAVEEDRGRRFVHLKSIFPRPQLFLGAMRAEFRIQLTDDRALAVFHHADPPPAPELASAGASASRLAQEGWQLWQSGRPSDAIPKFERAVALDPKNPEAWNGLGWASFNTGKTQEAEKAFDKVLSLNSNHPAALNGLGQIYLGQKKYDLAESNFLKAGPLAPAAWYGLAKLYLIQGKFDRAEKWAQKIVDSGQGDEGARAMLQAAKDKKLPDGLRYMLEAQ
jgi:Flp pilus assembly protein TadD